MGINIEALVSMQRHIKHCMPGVGEKSIIFRFFTDCSKFSLILTCHGPNWQVACFIVGTFQYYFFSFSTIF